MPRQRVEPQGSCNPVTWVVVEIMVLFWVPNIYIYIYYGTYYIGYPKSDLNFDNYPHW